MIAIGGFELLCGNWIDNLTSFVQVNKVGEITGLTQPLVFQICLTL